MMISLNKYNFHYKSVLFLNINRMTPTITLLPNNLWFFMIISQQTVGNLKIIIFMFKRTTFKIIDTIYYYSFNVSQQFRGILLFSCKTILFLPKLFFKLLNMK